ncbi:MAG: butyrate kinase [Alkaliphilus sp.]|nr:butyrate kinase [bacterium AH-315-G05]PHS33822.1 MAG: butyrate kinase [Alkaliphilus sp.]
MSGYVLAINPGSTSTKVAVFKGEENIIQKNLTHATEQLEKFERITDQYELRKDMILLWMNENDIKLSDLAAVVGRGGLLRPMPGGTYEVSDDMIKDLRIGIQGEHASNLGGIIAKEIAELCGVKSYIVDSVAVDEFEEVARISGLPDIVRKALGHSLNIKAVAHRASIKLNKKFVDLNFVIAHLGGGITIAPVKKGKLIDYNNANEMGPFSPERAGGVPSGALAKICFSKEYSLKEIKTMLRGRGGLTGYLGTNDAREVEKMINEGNNKAQLIFDAMGYQIAKEIGAMSTVLAGKIDAVILTGGLAHSKRLTEHIIERIGFIAPVLVCAGEDEMKALNEGVLRVINREERSKIYEEEVKSCD